MRIRALISAAAIAATVGAVSPAQATTVTIFMSNFQFCERSVPVGDGGAEGVCIPSQDEGHVTIVPKNVSVTLNFQYDDALCDVVVLCPGHNVRGGTGFTAGNSSGEKSNFTITKTFSQGNHPYICTVHQNFGMSGVIRAQ